MKTLSAYKKILLLLTFSSITLMAMAQDTSWTEKSAAKWLHKKEWKNGIKLDVFSAVNKVEFARQYNKNKALWIKVFTFLRDSDLTILKPGKYPIDGDNAYASITEAPSKEFDKTTWESHRKYIDLQYIIKGKEKIGVAPVSKATVIKPYNEKADGANYTTDGQFYIAEPGTFYLFFPQDAHRPSIKVDGYDVVKKLVIKIKVAE
ncbi:YhcH/YjgK/YiaL family protein [Mucilaginibacter frigoritolerans]|uniref:YhcH/YjgK/YiaL family protein n=1 Tax=Mucilaginibacter frigoritolerans TaxID=652788 RepID=A0A562UGC1_9SPHI|nr:YhcH/YjgK/YiaL family protein [Mucilaginibacter frigoritolerans]TWJ04858.1 YhcH/YjgK/YiaL family protein [Mucilaginibacter frigoritolerans]